MTRKEAREKSYPQYFTGIPCLNNHLTYRYTQSGTCSACVRSYSLPNTEFIEQKKQTSIRRAERGEKIATMITFRARLFTKDLAFFCAMLHAAALAHEPTITMREVWKGGEGQLRASDSAVHTFSCFASDLDALRASANQVFKEGCVTPAEVAEIRSRALQAIDAEMSVKV